MTTDRFRPITFCIVIKVRYFGGWGPRRGYDPEIRTRPRFFDNAPTHQVSSSYTFNRSQVIVLTNKQTKTSTEVDAAGNIHLRFAMLRRCNFRRSPPWQSKNRDISTTVWPTVTKTSFIAMFCRFVTRLYDEIVLLQPRGPVAWHWSLTTLMHWV